MIDIRNKIVALFSLCYFIRFCILLINTILLRKRITNLGTQLTKLPDILSSRHTLFIFIITTSIFSIILLITIVLFSKDFILLGFIFLPITELMKIVLSRRISNKNGIYEKGVILSTIISVKNIQSYSFLESNQIMINMNCGKTIKLPLNGNKDVIEMMFLNNHISSSER